MVYFFKFLNHFFFHFHRVPEPCRLPYTDLVSHHTLQMDDKDNVDTFKLRQLSVSIGESWSYMTPKGKINEGIIAHIKQNGQVRLRCLCIGNNGIQQLWKNGQQYKSFWINGRNLLKLISTSTSTTTTTTTTTTNDAHTKNEQKDKTFETKTSTPPSTPLIPFDVVPSNSSIVVGFFGDAFVDVQTSPMTSLPAWDEDRVVSSVSVFPGGSVVNTARHFGSLCKINNNNNNNDNTSTTPSTAAKAEAHLAVTLGDDALGELMFNTISKEQTVNMEHVVVAEETPMSTCLVLVGTGTFPSLLKT